MADRAHIPLKEKLAAAIWALLPPATQLTVLAWYGDAQRMKAEDVIGLVEFHHVDFHALGGSDAWWNLVPLSKAEHRDRTPRDISVIAKTKRLAKAHEDFKARILAVDKRPKPKRRQWPSRKLLVKRK